MEKRYRFEADLCEDFIGEVRRAGKWECYPETDCWDILLVRKVDGFQVGIQAKLRFNAHVIRQAIEQSPSWACAPGPDCRAVLVPEADGDLRRICSYIGITVIVLRSVPEHGVRYDRIEPPLPFEGEHWSLSNGWHEWAPFARHSLPDYVPDCRAGSSAPISLTRWKIAAIKLAILLEDRPITRGDFKHVGIDYRRWLPNENGWLRLTVDGWIAGPNLPNFRAQHPVNYEQIKADIAKWAPPGMARQAALL